MSIQILKDRIESTQKSFRSEINLCHSLEKLETMRISFLGRKGIIAELMILLKDMPQEGKRILGPTLNTLKAEFERTLVEKKQSLSIALCNQKEEDQKYFDVTSYIPQSCKGSLHPYTRVQEQIEDIFISMGYQVQDGTEVETDYYNFKALNIADDHPARDMHDTIWLNHPHHLMRTHTSPLQIRMMETIKPPLAVISSGRVYRQEATDASHDYMFKQFEAFYVDKNISLSNATATVTTFFQTFFNRADLTCRLRPGYFPFVEPGFEIDASCPFCKKGCSVCKQTGWIELAGAGLIHPNVFRFTGIDPKIYSGFAMGFGLTRLVMLKYNIPDVRLLHTTRVEFLEQF